METWRSELRDVDTIVRVHLVAAFDERADLRHLNAQATPVESGRSAPGRRALAPLVVSDLAREEIIALYDRGIQRLRGHLRQSGLTRPAWSI